MIKRQIEQKSKYRKSRKRLTKRGIDLKPLDDIVGILSSRNLTKLEIQQYKDHPLKGKYSGCRELHLLSSTSDWVLIYKIIGDTVSLEDTVLELHDTGSHSDLFGSEQPICNGGYYSMKKYNHSFGIDASANLTEVNPIIDGVCYVNDADEFDFTNFDYDLNYHFDDVDIYRKWIRRFDDEAD